MKLYIYPQNLKATANLWLWCLRDFALICVGLLLLFEKSKMHSYAFFILL